MVARVTYTMATGAQQAVHYCHSFLTTFVNEAKQLQFGMLPWLVSVKSEV